MKLYEVCSCWSFLHKAQAVFGWSPATATVLLTTNHQIHLMLNICSARPACLQDQMDRLPATQTSPIHSLTS